MCTTTRAIFGSSTTVRRVFPPCAPAVSGKTVRFILFDPKQHIDARNDLKAAISQVGVFYGNLKNTPGLPVAIKTDLSLFNFQTEYRPTAPDQATMENLGRMDFPVYLFATPGISSSSTSIDEVTQLMQRHQISASSFVRRVDFAHPDVPILAPVADNYKTIEDSWESKTVMGFGFPGIYYTTGNCHKLGLIKIDALLAQASAFDSEPDRFAWVLQHELGHMFALVHHPDTLMNEDYNRQFKTFLPIQIGHIRDMLKRMSP
jgi:hypothetical protein